MGLFGQIVGVVIETAKLPVAIAWDAVSLAGVIDNNGRPHTADQLDKIKDEARDTEGGATA